MNNTPKILYCATIFLGGASTAMSVTRTMDGAKAHGMVSGGIGNCTSALKTMTDGTWERFCHSESEWSVRVFEALTKHWEYLGCTPIEISTALLAQLEEK